jgi:hypothetical protein
LNDQVVLSQNGELCLAIPLFRILGFKFHYSGYTAFISNANAVEAYIIVTLVGAMVMSREFVEKKFEFLGEL